MPKGYFHIPDWFSFENQGGGVAVADVSGGLLYFIADGRHPIPASDWLYGLLTPGNGDIAA